MGTKRGSGMAKTARFRTKGSKPFRVTLWVLDEEREWIEKVAKEELPLTLRKQPRNGVVVTELIRYARESIERIKYGK